MPELLTAAGTHSPLLEGATSGSLSQQVLKLHEISVAAKHGMQQGDILLRVSVLPVDEQDGVPKDEWDGDGKRLLRDLAEA